MEVSGYKIKKMRELRNFTQSYVAERLCLSQSNYARIESNSISIGKERLKKLAEILDTAIENIIGFDEQVIFNINTNVNAIHNLSTQQNYLINEELKKMYEEKLQLLQDKINLLEENIRLLQPRKQST
ncbi:MAG: helix-turn-helix transcriptional regulator [Chitinophagales bacterium]|nr:helix-turn-helix transcriptional regulator [Chitinophagales bacterium]